MTNAVPRIRLSSKLCKTGRLDQGAQLYISWHAVLSGSLLAVGSGIVGVVALRCFGHRTALCARNTTEPMRERLQHGQLLPS